MFTEEEIKLYVDQTVFSKYKKFKVAQLRLNNLSKNYINCPTPDCEEAIEFDVTEEDTFMKCDLGHQFCAKCKTVGWHKGKCTDVKMIVFIL